MMRVKYWPFKIVTILLFIINEEKECICYKNIYKKEVFKGIQVFYFFTRLLNSPNIIGNYNSPLIQGVLIMVSS